MTLEFSIFKPKMLHWATLMMSLVLGPYLCDCRYGSKKTFFDFKKDYINKVIEVPATAAPMDKRSLTSCPVGSGKRPSNEKN
ncbi:hypothetical protein GJAV_G00036960 [Gymnothorax javanicus]|nr:hypothetical protein GJAV_G00036960 [Gymnothorax javanicus]